MHQFFHNIAKKERDGCPKCLTFVGRKYNRGYIPASPFPAHESWLRRVNSKNQIISYEKVGPRDYFFISGVRAAGSGLVQGP